MLAAARGLGGGLFVSLLLGGCVSTGGAGLGAGTGAFPPGTQALYQVCVIRGDVRTFLLHLHVEPTGAYCMTGLGRLGQTLFGARGGGEPGDRVALAGASLLEGPLLRSLVQDFRLAFIASRVWRESGVATPAGPVTRRFGSRLVEVRDVCRVDDGDGVMPMVFTVSNRARGYEVVAELAEPVGPEGG